MDVDLNNMRQNRANEVQGGGNEAQNGANEAQGASNEAQGAANGATSAPGANFKSQARKDFMARASAAFQPSGSEDNARRNLSETLIMSNPGPGPGVRADSGINGQNFMEGETYKQQKRRLKLEKLQGVYNFFRIVFKYFMLH